MMLDGIAITFENVVKLFTYSAVIGIAISITIWFIGFVFGTAISVLKKGMNS